MWRGRLAIAFVAVVLLFGRSASADQCEHDAKGEYRQCRSDCKEDFRSAKFACRGVDPTCGIACLAGRMSCFDDVDTILETGQLPAGGTLDNCVDGANGCRQRFEAAKAACGAPCNADPTCIQCVNDAQVANFICRDTCRDSWRLNPTVIALKQSCRDTFHACVHACPPLP